MFWLVSLPVAAVAQTPGQTAHPTDLDKAEEHDSLLELVPAAAVTKTFNVTSGNWSTAANWSPTGVPGAGARVLIPAGRTATYDVNAGTTALDWLRVEGTLSFATSSTTHLLIHTIVVTPGGSWIQGTAATPVSAAVTSTVTFSDVATGGTNDVTLLGHGFIGHGVTSIYGSPKTAWRKTAAGSAGDLPAGAGTNAVTLDSAPVGWNAGDQIVIGAVSWHRDASNVRQYQDEAKTIASIGGAALSWTGGLAWSHTPHLADMRAHIGNLTRNVRFQSANPAVLARRGHVMFMHSASVNVYYAGFYDLGRTDKKIPVTDAIADNGNPPGANPRGRYPVHFHRTGFADKNSVPANVVGCAVSGSPGWGIVNHDGHVIIDGNFTYNIDGNHVVTENGAELGEIRNNLAIFSRGDNTTAVFPAGEKSSGRQNNHDFGHIGIGFWGQSGSVAFKNNIAISMRGPGYAIVTRSPLSSSLMTTSNLRDPYMGGGLDAIVVRDVPFLFDGNLDYACGNALGFTDVEIRGIGPTRNIVSNHTSLNTHGSAFVLEYGRNLELTNARFVRLATLPINRVAIDCFNLIDHFFDWDVRAPIYVRNVIIRGYRTAAFNNWINDNDGADYEASDKARVLLVGSNPLFYDADDDGQTSDDTAKLSTTPQGAALITSAAESALLPMVTLSIDPGPYTGTQTVSASLPGVTGATIYYKTGTWDGSPGQPSDPAEFSFVTPGGSGANGMTLYTGPITVNSTRRIMFIATKPGSPPGRIRVGYYKIN